MHRLHLLEHKLVDGSARTVTGATLAENLEPLPGLKEGQDVVLPLSEPIKETGHLQILYGNLAPEGCVGKILSAEITTEQREDIFWRNLQRLMTRRSA